MQTTSELYKSIISGPDYWFENRLVIDGVGIFSESVIFSMSSSEEVFKDSLKVGCAISSEIDIRMIAVDNIPDMATLRPQTRVCNSSQQSEWIPQGVYYIDTRETTKNSSNLNILILHGFDAMLRAEQYFQSSSITGSSVDTVMVDEIARIMGIEVDSRTYSIMTEGYTIPLPVSYTLREILGYIASMYVGIFVITNEEKLRLVSLLELPEESNYLIDTYGSTITFGGNRILV